MSANLLIFAVLAAISVLAALGVILFPNAIRSALSLVVNFVVLAVLYFLLNAEMLGITQIVVYAGAIMVLFLFVIMVLKQVATKALEEKRDWKKYLAGLLGLAIAVMVGTQALVPLNGAADVTAPDAYGGPHAIGRMLFSEYAYPFESVSVLLLVGIVGSILLAKRRIR